MAVVIVRTAMQLREPELVAWCRDRLAIYKCPRVFQFRFELPKNTLGKVLKDELVVRREPVIDRTGDYGGGSR
jgi:long-chain acyl-CoA synthetase